MNIDAVPSHWTIVTLGQVCEFLDAKRVPLNEEERDARISNRSHDDLYPYYGANGQVGWVDDYLFDEPLILLAEDGGPFGSHVDPIAYAIKGKAWVNNHAHVLRPKHEYIDFEYCLYSLMIRPDIEYLVSGTTRGKLNLEAARQIPVPLPPLAEQRRIAAILRAADEERRRRHYIQSLSQTLLDDVFVQMFGKYMTNGGPGFPLGSAVKITGGGTPSRDVPHYFRGSIPWVTAKDMSELYLSDTEEHVTRQAIDESAAKLVPAGSILIVVKSKVLMHRLPVAITTREMCHNQDIKAIAPVTDLDHLFLLYVLKYYEADLLNRARGANTEGLTVDMLNELWIPTVPKGLQERFSEIAITHEHACRQQYESARQSDHLFDTLLHRAFTGELSDTGGHSVDDVNSVDVRDARNPEPAPVMGHIE